MRALTTQLIRQLTSTADHRSDGELLSEFLSDRSEAAFAELVRRHGAMVWGVCSRTLPDRADAEDAFQTAFMVLVRRGRKLTRYATIGPWLHRVAVWTARNARRRNAHRLSKRTSLNESIPANVAGRDLALDLDEALMALPEKFRSPIVLCHLLGYSRADAALRLGCAEGTLSAWLSRGLAKLRGKLGDLDPARPLGIAAVAVPVGLSGSAVRAATALQAAAGTSTVLSTLIPQLVEGVIRMFWIKKATAATTALFAIFALGVGVGVSTHQIAPTSFAQENPPQKTFDPGQLLDFPAAPSGDPKLEIAIDDVEIQMGHFEKVRGEILEEAKRLKDELLRLGLADGGRDTPKDEKAQTLMDKLARLQEGSDGLAKKLAELQELMRKLQELKQQHHLLQLKLLQPTPETENARGKEQPNKTPATPADELEKQLALLKKKQVELSVTQAVEAMNAKVKEEALQREMKKIQDAIAALQKQKEAGPTQKLKGSSTAAYFQLTLGAKDAAWPFQVEEFGEDGKPMGSIAFQNAAVLGRFLSRVMKDPTAPRTVRIAAADRTPKALIESALEACKTAGIARSLVVEDKADPRVILDPFDDSIRKALEKRSREKVRELEEGRKRQVELDALSAAEKLMQKQQLDNADQDYLKKHYELIDRANELLKSQKAEQQKQNPPKP